MLHNYENFYTSVGCNKSSNITAWNKNNIIAYAFCNSIAIYSPYNLFKDNSGNIIQILNGHNSEITYITWISLKVGNVLLSAAKTGLIILWMNKEIRFQWHDQSVTSIACKEVANNTLFIVSSSMDSTINFAMCDLEGKILASERKDLGYDISLCLAITTLSPNQVIVACGLTNGDIHLYPILLNVGHSESEKPGIAFFQKFPHILRGHQDWVRDLSFLTLEDERIYLASCSQDCTIRVWEMVATSRNENITSSESDYRLLPQTLPTNTDIFCAGNGKDFDINLETTLHVHRNWIYSIEWHPFASVPDSPHRLAFLTASIDETCILWTYDNPSGTWLDEVRLGTLKGLGFYGARFSPDGDKVLANAINGSLYLWKRVSSPAALNGNQGDGNKWVSDLMITGHSSACLDLAWEPRGRYLVTTSADQTTRIHAPWIDPACPSDGTARPLFMEISRSQVHGYDMTCVASMGPVAFASGSEEKVVRVFKAPKTFLSNFERWTRTALLDHTEDAEVRLPDTASNNPLDLTNLSVYSTDSTVERQNITANAVFREEYPTENVLHQSTLWPEERKLYGHGYDIYCLDYNATHNILASACKATKPEFASLHLWDCKSWRLLTKLTGHSLTITRVQFSPDGRYILTVSRDRTWIVYVKTDDHEVYRKIDGTVGTNKKDVTHSRIIWDCCFVPGPSANYSFVTVSRDKKAILWKLGNVLGEVFEPSGPLWNSNKNQMVSLESSITAVAVKNYNYTMYVVALGLETGDIKCYDISHLSSLDHPSSFTFLFQIPVSHSLTVKRLSFQPRHQDTSNNMPAEADKVLILASCSEDYSVRLHKFTLTNQA